MLKKSFAEIQEIKPREDASRYGVLYILPTF
jgi:hypothetical protein